MTSMVPQTSPHWRQQQRQSQQSGNERTKDAVSVMVARNCAIGTTRTYNTTSLTTAQATAAGAALGHHRRQILRTNSAMTWQRICLAGQLLLLLLLAENFGAQLVTCSTSNAERSATEPQLTTFTRSTLPDRPMTTQNDLIRAARNSTALMTAKKPTTAETAKTVNGSSTLGLSSAAAAAAAPTTITTAATKSIQIGLTMAPTTVAEIQTASTTITTTTAMPTTATPTSASTTKATMFISTIYPASTTAFQIAAATATAMAAALTETDAHNSIEMATAAAVGSVEVKVSNGNEHDNENEDENENALTAVLQQPHPANTDSLTKGFSIPTFLPPFPVFAAADLPAYRAAAAAAAAAAEAAEAAAAAAATTKPSETSTLSAEEQRQQMFNEQHSYLASHNGQLEPGQKPRRNLTMPVLNITAQMGNHAYMPCQIHRLSDKPVSWVRLRDGHIISVDETTFISDERFQSIYQEDNDYTWSLQLKYVQPIDAGWYECQMATEPKLSAKVHLDVITPKTELIGDQSRFVKAGSKVALHCIVRGTLDPPKYIIWFRGQKKISESDERTGWYTQLDRNIFGSVADNQNTIGSLIIPFVRKEDSGNYTCQPSNSVSVSVDLHVLSGEYSASAIMSAATRHIQHSSTFLLLALRLSGLIGALGMRTVGRLLSNGT